MTATTAGGFDADTRAARAGDNEYTATVTDRWNALGGTANGGYLLALCLQALRRDMPLPDPLAVSAFFLRPGVPGPARVRTEVARAGRRFATGEARLHQGGKEAVRICATFTDLARAAGRTLVRNAAPLLPPPDACTDLLGGAGMPGVTIAERVEYRFARVPGWWRGEPGGELTAEFWMRFKDGRDADLPALALLVDAAAPVVLDIGETGSSTLQLTVHLRARPAPGWLACRVTTRHIIDGHHEEDFEIWDSGGALVAQARQLAALNGDGTRHRTP
ncbi:acyl-CoA thioesterase [Spinactinospora alkalitolerans]|uniref:Acyl-CoA thioesterase n=1 Tax=Spinactinospora alkalitolerans TaxID=687207 RepID=A0A852U0A6_9ACTN|nr:thioesterase family protein [Spinactinospora alkalitolerans]NYE50256.1 acyl-CoA thioesterase [Spinactinospora alkalitolerans]